jgi:hypothetical protein
MASMRASEAGALECEVEVASGAGAAEAGPAAMVAHAPTRRREARPVLRVVVRLKAVALRCSSKVGEEQLNYESALISVRGRA